MAKLPKGAGPGTDNSQAASRGIMATARRMMSPPTDIRLPDRASAGRKVALGAMRGLLQGKSPSKASR